MKPQKHSEGGTKQRLLDSAVEVFAEVGYRDATIAGICRRAGANIAAVNYHFGHKDALYAEAWRLAFRRSLAAHPPDGGVPADAPPEDRLRGRIRALLARILDPDSAEFSIMGREIMSPTGLLREPLQEAVQGLRAANRALVRELLGEVRTDDLLNVCEVAVMGPCLHMMMHFRRPLCLRDGAAPAGPPMASPDDVEALAEHLTRFALAGLREMRRLGETGRVAPVRFLDDLNPFQHEHPAL